MERIICADDAAGIASIRSGNKSERTERLRIICLDHARFHRGKMLTIAQVLGFLLRLQRSLREISSFRIMAFKVVRRQSRDEWPRR